MPAFKLDQRANFQAMILLDALEDENESDIYSILANNQVDASYVPHERGMAPLHYVCSMENKQLALDVTRHLLERGANANVRNNEDMTPLHVAAIMGHAELVRVLLKFGARADLLDAERKTPLHYAIEECHFEVLQLLREHIHKQKCDAAAKPDPNSKCTTPERLLYNFDTASPYHINITHRRHRPQPDFPTLTDAAKEQTAKSQSSLHTSALTKTNLEHLSQSTNALERSCVSLIEAWREKVQRSRARQSILRQFDDIDAMLNDVMENEHLNFTNTVLREKAPSDNQEEVAEATKRSLPANMSLGALIQKAAQAHLVNDDTRPLEQSQRSMKVKTSSRPKVERQPAEEAKENSKQQCLRWANVVAASSAEYFLQMTEAYVHTDDDYGLVFYQTKLLSNREEAEQSEPTSPRHNAAKPLANETDPLHPKLPSIVAHSSESKSTKRLYIKRLIKYKRKTPLTAIHQRKTGAKITKFSVELSYTTRSEESFRGIPQYAQYEAQLRLHFANQQLRPKMREGPPQQNFIFMLLDPHMSCNLPGERVFLDMFTVWTRFLNSIFYVGISKSTRPFAQLYEAMKLHSRLRSEARKLSRNGSRGLAQKPAPSTTVPFKPPTLKTVEIDKKLQRILDIWSSGNGVVCLHVFHDLLPAEAHTFEAAIIDALGLQHLSNVKRGEYYGPAQTWTMKQKKYLGIMLLYKAMQAYLAEGESQLSPSDLI